MSKSRNLSGFAGEFNLPETDGTDGQAMVTDGAGNIDFQTVDVSVTPAAVSDQANTSTGYFDLPAGNSDQRPGTPAAGMVRFNTETGEPEWYDPTGSQWLGFSKGSNYAVDYLVVAGGGAGGDANTGYESGGGGAGGFLDDSVTVIVGTSYTVTVGAGGTQSNGGNSEFGIITAIGGGRGGIGGVSGGSNGGSGGGGTHPGSAGGSGTAGQGNDGGDCLGSSTSAGGGGAGAAGQNSVATGVAGSGGVGLQSSLSGVTTYYAGGGGGGAGTPGSGGLGGGANGRASGTPGYAGSANTGGGGGGIASAGAVGGNGGSGIVIIRYLGAQRATGGTVTSASGYTIHTFTSSGTFIA